MIKNSTDAHTMLERIHEIARDYEQRPKPPARFDVAPDVYETWKGIERREDFPPDVVELVRRTAGFPQWATARVHVTSELPPGHWVAFDSRGNELGRGTM